MCGIAGYLDYNRREAESEVVIKSMIATLVHRGPNDQGELIIEEENFDVALAQRRLSIIDLSPAGHQPMIYKDNVLVFNGEIYNYKEIRKQLEELDHSFNSETDTEVILHAFEEWGVKCVDVFIGMFAFLVYNKKTKKAFAFRDRVGVKPFYYYFENGLFLFASELKAICAHKHFPREIDHAVLPNYFQYGYIAAPYSIFKNTKKLLPGHFLEFDGNTQVLKLEKYWDINDFFQKPKFTKSYKQIKEELKVLMKSAFEYRLVGDVPVGVFLSGGYDSTALTGILNTEETRNINTFTIGFAEGINEAPAAKRIADYLGTNHREYICTVADAKDIIPRLAEFCDEPFGDISIIPTILVSKIAKEEVKVVLSADGGDEMFCGYAGYFQLAEYLMKIQRLPKNIARVISNIIEPLERTNGINSNRKFHQLSVALKTRGYKTSVEQSAFLFRGMSEKPKGYINCIFNQKFSPYKSSFNIETTGFIEELDVAMAIDFKSYLPDDILTKVDRATMSQSIEGREPFLDHRLLEFVAQIPMEYKYNGKDGKLILKDIVHELVPNELMNRPKTGFDLPIFTWLKQDLSYLLEEYLSKEALSRSGIFNVDFIIKEVNKFKRDELHYSSIIWNILIFQMWYKRWI